MKPVRRRFVLPSQNVQCPDKRKLLERVEGGLSFGLKT
jgi:hypothetical protein